VVPQVLVIEFTVVNLTNEYYLPILSLEAGLRSFLANLREHHRNDITVKLVQPGTWKTTPAGKFKIPCSDKMSTHEKDALRMAYWAWKFGNLRH
jgi:hypothetical protein